eukprot:322154-Hanusia_phi.AAC.2
MGSTIWCRQMPTILTFSEGRLAVSSAMLSTIIEIGRTTAAKSQTYLYSKQRAVIFSLMRMLEMTSEGRIALASEINHGGMRFMETLSIATICATKVKNWSSDHLTSSPAFY